MNKLGYRLRRIIANEVPISAICPYCSREIPEETVIDMSRHSSTKWSSLIQKVSQVVYNHLTQYNKGGR